jgi:hypothetical protein
MEQEDLTEPLAASDDDGAAVKETITILTRLGQLIHELRDKKMIELHHQLANCLSVYLVEKELKAKGW